MFSVMGFYAFLLLAGFFLSMVFIDIYTTKINARPWVRSLAGASVAWLFLLMFLFAPAVNTLQLPAFVLEVYAFFVLVAPWITGLWFAQLYLIEDRWQANSRTEPSTTWPASRVQE